MRAAVTCAGPMPSPIPVLVAVPHAGRAYTDRLLDRMRNPGFAALRLEDRYVDRMSALYAQLNAAVGIRMRDGVTEGDLALAIMSVIDGMADHRRINPPFVDRARRVDMGPEGPMDWHLAGLAVYGVYAAFTEERDDETATAGEEP